MKKTFFALVNLLLFVTFLQGLQSCGSKQVVKAEKRVNEKKVVKQSGAIKLTPKLKMEIKKNYSFGFSKKKAKLYKKALEYFDKALAIDPQMTVLSKKVLYYKGQCFEELKDTEKAKKCFEAYLEKEPSHNATLVKLEYMYFSENNLEKAIELNEKMLEITPTNIDLIKKIANYHHQIARNLVEDEGEDSEDVKDEEILALEWFNKFLEKNPKDEQVQEITTFLTKKYMDVSVLKAKYEENLKKDSKDFKTMAKLAKIYIRENNETSEVKARKLYDKIFNNDPTDKQTLKRLIKLYKNSPKKYLSLNIRAAKLNPDEEIYHLNIASAYRNLKKFKAARNECNKALKINSKNKNAYKIWASLYTDAVSEHTGQIEFQDKLVYTIAYGLYRKGGFVRSYNSLKENGQAPSRSDIFTNGSTRRPKRKVYNWINVNWPEVKYIDEYLKKNG